MGEGGRFESQKASYTYFVAHTLIMDLLTYPTGVKHQSGLSLLYVLEIL